MPNLTRAEEDLRLWHQWKLSKHPDDLKNLLRKFDPVVHKFATQYAHSGVPYPALEAEAKLNTVKAFQTYDPQEGTQLNTHVTNYMQKTQRLVYEYKSLTRIPEHRAIKASTYLRVKDFLKEKLDRDPTLAELKDELNASHLVNPALEAPWSDNEIGRMNKELHKTLLSSEDTLQDLEVQKPSRESAIIDFVYYDLVPQEQAVYEHLTGLHGKEKLDGLSIAKKLKLTPSKVSRIRQKIAEKFEYYRDKPGVY